ncbi:hypothetical protein V6Z12_D10G298600 [Gossypium hirsutum]|uniref:Uncharacterized protein isoform X1 n=1 Tax=Gossypium hirsutum TaxID=3635 RepID=A0A1U8MXC4_GOSHI|nr:uncharacterized protein LOC107942345 isoform X1 [Gossypium hirsutum]
MDVFVVVLVGCFGKERNSGSARFHQQWPLFCSQLLYYSYSLLHRFLSQIDTLFPSPYCTTIGLEVQNGYGLIETSPCVAGRQPYYNVYNSLFRSVFEIYRYGSVCFFLVAFSETDFRFRHHCFVPCFKSIDLSVCSFCLFPVYFCEWNSKADICKPQCY